MCHSCPLGGTLTQGLSEEFTQRPKRRAADDTLFPSLHICDKNGFLAVRPPHSLSHAQHSTDEG
ncbi:hypothetical protein JZ751_020435 [Albula glossodonta]|uniref:Uncharacterized protein n=1 Tax=Albula glossodonta TaxID=121402 RepID=A0A8T2MTX2_9TELE|nr:hypothetical protein JZ751_020435 [Albula glossodonta]